MTRICIDGHNLALPTGSGIATYARTLISGIRGLGARAEVLHGPLTKTPSDPLLREITVEDARLRLKPPPPNRLVQVAFARLGRRARYVAPSGRILWPAHAASPSADGFWLSEDLFRISGRAYSKSRVITPIDFSVCAERTAPDLMHWTYPMPLRARGVPNIYTFHDLIPLKLPHTTLDDKRRYLDLCRSVARRADHIVAVSETTRQDVISLLGVEPERITTTWQSTDLPPGALDRSDEAVAREIEDTFSLPWKGYFIFFGAIEPKKNLGRLVEAYLRSGIKTPLVVVGGRAWLDKSESGFLNEVIASKSSAGQRLLRYDYLPRSTLIDLVRGARGTLFPSLYEGFGLPVLESMMLGTPVMASNAGSLPEIAGQAAILTDPYDIEDMAVGIRRLDADPDLRAELSILGLAQASRFSGDAYRTRLGRLYRTLGVLGEEN